MAELRACPICSKLVDIDAERHTLFHCRNFLLSCFYVERNPIRKKKLQERINIVNKKLGLRSMNLLDTDNEE